MKEKMQIKLNRRGSIEHIIMKGSKIHLPETNNPNDNKFL